MGASVLGWVIRCTVAIGVLSTLSGTPARACDRPLTWGINEYPPYHVRTAEGSWGGLDTELITAILDRAGCTATFVEMDGKRRLAEIEHGRLDFTGAASITPERQLYGLFSAAYRPERMVLFLRRDDPRRQSVHTLAEALSAGVSIAVQPGAAYGPDFARLSGAFLAQGLLVERRGTEARLRMVARNRVDATPEDLFSGLATARSEGLAADLDASRILLNDESVHLLFSRAAVPVETLRRINAAIGAVRDDGTYARIMDKYGVPPDREMGTESATDPQAPPLSPTQ